MKLLSMFSHKKSKKGFTLVELVIVIAVLAIIAAIAIPTVNGVVNNANAATDASNSQAITMTIKTFQAEYEARVTFPLSFGTDKQAIISGTANKDDLNFLFSVYGTTFPEAKTSGNEIYWDSSTKTAAIKATGGANDTEITGATKVADLGIY